MRRDVRVVEGARLESVCRGNSTVGSNPTLSANSAYKAELAGASRASGTVRLAPLHVPGTNPTLSANPPSPLVDSSRIADVDRRRAHGRAGSLRAGAAVGALHT